jgi:hypothetical protein
MGLIGKLLLHNMACRHVYCVVDHRWETTEYSSMAVIQNIMFYEAFSRH